MTARGEGLMSTAGEARDGGTAPSRRPGNPFRRLGRASTTAWGKGPRRRAGGPRAPGRGGNGVQRLPVGLL
jgi:hypothetical protein